MKEEVPKKKLSPGELFIVFIKSPRGKGIIKLIIFFLIFLIVRLLDYKFGNKENRYDNYSSSSSSSSSSSVIEEKTYEKELQKLTTQNYGFYIKITKEEETISVFGDRKEDKIIGYVNTIKDDQFTIENNVVYNTTNGSKTIDENILKNINYNYLYASYVINLIKSNQPEIKSENNKTIYSYNLSNHQIVFTYNNVIERIDLKELETNTLYEIYYGLTN